MSDPIPERTADRGIRTPWFRPRHGRVRGSGRGAEAG